MNSLYNINVETYIKQYLKNKLFLKNTQCPKQQPKMI